jgi:hypothetical protein
MLNEVMRLVGECHIRLLPTSCGAGNRVKLQAHGKSGDHSDGANQFLPNDAEVLYVTCSQAKPEDYRLWVYFANFRQPLWGREQWSLREVLPFDSHALHLYVLSSISHRPPATYLETVSSVSSLVLETSPTGRDGQRR